MWGYERLLELPRAADRDHPPLRERASCSRPSTCGARSLTINNDDFTAGLPNASEDEIKRVDYSYANFDRPHNFVVNFIYQTPKVANGVLGVDRSTTGRSPASTAGRAAGPTRSTTRSPASARRNLVGNDGNPNARIVAEARLRRRRRLEQRSVSPAQHLVLPAPPRRQRRRRVGALLRVEPGRSTTSTFRSPRRSRSARQVRFEVRLDMFNALNHTQFIGVNSTANFAVHGQRRDHEPAARRERQPDPEQRLRLDQPASAPPRTLQLVTRLTF